MMYTVYTETFPAPPVCREEILRYAGARKADPALSALLEEALKEAENCLRYKVCWQKLPVSYSDGELDLTFGKTGSKSLLRHMDGCSYIILFGATVGIGLDRLIARYGRISPARGLMMQALGAERIEALCDAFCDHLAEEYAPLKLRQRFSPGYGDLPLQAQRAIFDALQCHKEIGLYLNESLLMSPTKSVTAIVGIGGGETCTPGGCAGCGKTDCAMRK